MATQRTFYVDDDNSWRLNADGSRNFDKPKIKYGDKVSWAVKIRSMLTGTIASSNWGDAATFRAAIGQDFIHNAIQGSLTAGFSAAVTAITADGFTSAPPAAGFITLTNAGGQTESVYYSEYTGTWASASTVLTFVVSATLSYAYLNDNSCDADYTPPMVRVGNSAITSTSKATGDFVVEFDALNNIFKAAIGTASQIDAYLEFVGIDASGYEIHSVIIPLWALNAVDPGAGGNVAPSVSLIPKLLTLTSTPTPTTALSSIDATAAIGSYGMLSGYYYKWMATATVIRWPLENDW